MATSASTQPSITTQEQVDQRLRAQHVAAMVQTQSEVTPIPKVREAAFREWLKTHHVRDLDAPDSHYDYRGAFLAGATPDATGHWPDTFKQHGHPTFSVESQYSSSATDGGHWEGETFVPTTAAPSSSTNTTPVPADPLTDHATAAFNRYIAAGDPDSTILQAFKSASDPAHDHAVRAFRRLMGNTIDSADAPGAMQQHPSFPIAFPETEHQGPFDSVIYGMAQLLKEGLQGAVNIVAGPPIPPEADTGALIQKQSDVEQRLGHPWLLTPQQQRENRTAAALVASTLVGGGSTVELLTKLGATGLPRTALASTAAGAAFGALRPRGEGESLLGAVVTDALFFGGLGLAGGLVGKYTRPIQLDAAALEANGVRVHPEVLSASEYGKAIFQEAQAISDQLHIELGPKEQVSDLMPNVVQVGRPTNIGPIRLLAGSPSHWERNIPGPAGQALGRVADNLIKREALEMRLRGEWDAVLNQAEEALGADIPAMGEGGLRDAFLQERKFQLGKLLNELFEPTELPLSVPKSMLAAFTIFRNRTMADRETLRLLFGEVPDFGIPAYLAHVHLGDIAVVDATTEAVYRITTPTKLRQAIAAVMQEKPGVPLKVTAKEFLLPADFAGLGLTGQRAGMFIARTAKAFSLDPDEVAQVMFQGRLLKIKPGKKFFGHSLARGDPPLPDWEQDPFVAFRAYAAGFARKIAHHDTEQKVGAVIQALSQIKGTEVSVEALTTYMNRVLGRPSVWEQKSREFLQGLAHAGTQHLTPGIQEVAEKLADPRVLVRKIAVWESVARLGYSPVAWYLQLAQTVINTASAIGYGPTLRGIRMFLDRSQHAQVDALLRALDIDLVVPLATADEVVVRNLGQVSPWHPLYLFNKGSTANKAIAALAKYQEQVLKGADIRQALDEGRRFGNDMEFNYGTADAPRLLQGPLGTGVFQFRKFLFKELEFMWELRKNPAGLARFHLNVLAMAGIGGLMGLPPYLLLDWATGKLTGETITERVQAAFPKASRGLPGIAGIDLGANVAVGLPRDVGDTFGPGVTDIWTIAYDLLGKGSADLIRGKQGYLTPADKGRIVDQLVPGVARRLIESYHILDQQAVRAPSGALKFRPKSPTTEATLRALGFRSIPRAEEQRVETTQNRIKQIDLQDEHAVVQAMVQAYLAHDGERFTQLRQEAAEHNLVIMPSQLQRAIADALVERTLRGVKEAPRELRENLLERLQGVPRP